MGWFCWNSGARSGIKTEIWAKMEEESRSSGFSGEQNRGEDYWAELIFSTFIHCIYTQLQ